MSCNLCDVLRYELATAKKQAELMEEAARGVYAERDQLKIDLYRAESHRDHIVFLVKQVMRIYCSCNGDKDCVSCSNIRAALRTLDKEKA